MGIRLLEFHKTSSLQNKVTSIWLHRWIIWKIFTLFFPYKVTKKKNPGAVMAFSFQATEEARERFDFLQVLAGLCFKYTHLSTILSDRDKLKAIFNSSDAATIWNLGKSLIPSGDITISMQREIVTTMSYARQQVKKKMHLDAATNETQFQFLRACVFQLLLEKASYDEIRKSIIDTLTPGYHQRLREQRAKVTAKKVEARKNQASFTEAVSASHRNSAASATPIITQEEAQALSKRRTELLNVYDVGRGQLPPYIELLKSQRDGKDRPDPVSAVNEDRPSPVDANPLIAEALMESAQAPTNEGSDFNLADLSCIDDLVSPLSNFNLASQSEMDRLFCLHLKISCSFGESIIAKMSPIEVYSAGRL